MGAPSKPITSTVTQRNRRRSRRNAICLPKAIIPPKAANVQKLMKQKNIKPEEIRKHLKNLTAMQGKVFKLLNHKF